MCLHTLHSPKYGKIGPRVSSPVSEYRVSAFPTYLPSPKYRKIASPPRRRQRQSTGENPRFPFTSQRQSRGKLPPPRVVASAKVVRGGRVPCLLAMATCTRQLAPIRGCHRQCTGNLRLPHSRHRQEVQKNLPCTRRRRRQSYCESEFPANSPEQKYMAN